MTFVNDCAAELTGWPAAEALGRPLSKVFRTLDAHTRRWVDIPLERGAPTRPRQGARRARRNGALVRIQLSAIRDASTLPAASCSCSATSPQARHARAALEESEARFRVLADQTPVLLWMCDADACVRLRQPARGSNSPAARWTRKRATAGPPAFIRRISGRSRRALTDAFDKREPFTARISDCAATTASTAGCSTTACRASTATARFAGYIGACVDITERKEAEATIGNFEQRKSAFLASLAHELAQSARADPQLDRAAAADPREQTIRVRARAGHHRAAMRAPRGNRRRPARPVAHRQRQHPAEARARRCRAGDRARGRAPRGASFATGGQQLDVDVARERLRVIADADRLDAGRRQSDRQRVEVHAEIGRRCA